MTYYPVIIVLILAIIDWIAADRKIKPLEYFAKPATMIALLLWVGLTVRWGGGMLWFSIGLVFCLGGDVFLMLPKDQFILGLVSFLLGQICFVIGFNSLVGMFNLWSAILIVILVGYIFFLYRKLSKGLDARGKGSLRIPVLVYAIGISLMVYSAGMAYFNGWGVKPALFAGIGALLFYISDSTLAWDRFINPLSHARLRTMVSYHLGVIGIAIGAMLFAAPM